MKKHLKKGFTLVELLIVIALLGALAIGLIGAIDPFEQLKKGTDTGTRNNVSEVHGAIIRYFALKGIMPWCADAVACAGAAGIFSGVALNLDPIGPHTVATTAMARMIAAGELKANFPVVSSGDLGKIFVSGNSDAATVTVCYKPVSKSFQADVNTKYLVNGADGVNCKSAPAGANPVDCFWCVQ